VSIKTLLRSCATIAVLLPVIACNCENSELGSVASPTGDYRAVTFERDCGANASPVVHVSVLKKEAIIGDRGNAFVGRPGDVIAGDGRAVGDWVTVRWLSADRVLVSYARNVTSIRKELKVGSVAVEFSAPRTR